MTFLKNWRMAMAADLLCQPNETVGTVADKVGYSTPFAFSSAFKTCAGIEPAEAQRRCPGCHTDDQLIDNLASSTG